MHYQPNAPTVVIVPGFWEGRETYNATTSEIISAGYACTTVQLPSTGTVPPNNPTMHDDINAIRRVLEDILERDGKEVVLVMHSVGGFLGSNAIEGMSVEERKAQGKDGGARKLLFLTAGLLPEGTLHTTPPFCDIQPSGRLFCKDPLSNLFHDLTPSEANYYMNKLSCQPGSGWDGEVTYTGCKKIPSMYLVCKNDRLLPEALQRQMAEMAGSQIRECEAGHMVQCSMPAVVAECVREAAGGGE